mmetsp:Transcript_39790/g.94347  ORF Transcript_39790/g.94347 Transcript_39790/m.94347 type:complete len:236 (-) Transcript_39790:2-709(-)
MPSLRSSSDRFLFASPEDRSPSSIRGRCTAAGVATPFPAWALLRRSFLESWRERGCQSCWCRVMMSLKRPRLQCSITEGCRAVSVEKPSTSRALSAGSFGSSQRCLVRRYMPTCSGSFFFPTATVLRSRSRLNPASFSSAWLKAVSATPDLVKPAAPRSTPGTHAEKAAKIESGPERAMRSLTSPLCLVAAAAKHRIRSLFSGERWGRRMAGEGGRVRPRGRGSLSGFKVTTKRV